MKYRKFLLHVWNVSLYFHTWNTGNSTFMYEPTGLINKMVLIILLSQLSLLQNWYRSAVNQTWSQSRVGISDLPLASCVTFHVRHYCCLFSISRSLIWIFFFSFLIMLMLFYTFLNIWSIFIEAVLTSLSISCIICGISVSISIDWFSLLPPQVLGHIFLLLWMPVTFLLEGDIVNFMWWGTDFFSLTL